MDSVIFGGCTGMRGLELRNNSLSAIDLTGITTLYVVRLDSNNLTENAIESILLNLDQSGAQGGTVNLTGNSAPNEASLTYAGNLLGKGWDVSLDESDIQAVPLPPSNISVSVDLSDVMIGWNDNSLDEDGFIVEKSSDNVTFTQLAVTPVNSHSYSDTNVVEGETYYYRVMSYNSIGNSASVQIEAGPIAEKESLFASYALDGNGVDISGNGINATVMGTLSFVDGVNGQAGDFDAVDDYLDINSDETYDLTEFSVSAWLQSDNGSRTCAYVNVHNNFHIRTRGGEWDIVLSTAGGANISSGYDFVPGEWHHHVVTVNNLTRTVDFYVDGAKVGESHTFSDAIANPVINFDAYIGQYSSNYMWDGRIDGVNFYTESLTESEILELYSNGN